MAGSKLGQKSNPFSAPANCRQSQAHHRFDEHLRFLAGLSEAHAQLSKLAKAARTVEGKQQVVVPLLVQLLLVPAWWYRWRWCCCFSSTCAAACCCALLLRLLLLLLPPPPPPPTTTAITCFVTTACATGTATAFVIFLQQCWYCCSY